MTADEKKILLLYDWERDMPTHCQRCDANPHASGGEPKGVEVKTVPRTKSPREWG